MVSVMAKKKKKQKHLLGKNEFLFNFFSIIIVIGIAVYFGARSLYYYSKQNIKIQEESQTLNGLIIHQNRVVQDNEDGLHQDSNGYYFKGNITNNYVLFANRLFRVIRVNNDNSIKMVSESYAASFMWGDSSPYQESNLYNWLTKTSKEYSGIYYDTIPNVEKVLSKTKYSEDILNGEKVKDGSKKGSEYVTTLGVKDYVLANGKSSYLNNGSVFFLLGLSNDDENLYIEDDGSIQKCDNLEGYGVRPVITLKKNIEVTTGDGTAQNPYVVAYGEEKTAIDQYVKLGNDIWKIYSDKNGVLKLYKNEYIVDNNQEFLSSYSDTNSIFDLKDKKNIAYYLNNVYYNSLVYAPFLLDSEYYIGEISDDAGYDYTNIYKEKVVCKVGLLNIFDYNPASSLNNFFYLNTTSLVGSMEYNRSSNGILGEVDVRELRHVVPTISIQKNMIKSGNGTLSEPYVLE